MIAEVAKALGGGTLGANLKGIDLAHVLDGLQLDPVDDEPTLQVSRGPRSL